MPRRPPPTALLLHSGPMPTRNYPKHILPLPPLPIVCRQSHSKVAAQLTATIQPILVPSINSHNTASSFNLYSLGNLAAASNSSVTIFSSEESPVSRSRSSSLSGSPYGAVPAKTVQGPWDRSTAFSFSGSDMDALLTPPKPAVSNPNPLW